MKLNFWQWIGVIFIVVAVIGYFVYHSESTPPKPSSIPAPATTLHT